MASDTDLTYLTTEEILAIHRDIIEEDGEADPGIQNRGSIEYTLDFIEEGIYGEVPQGIHEKAAEQMRLLIGNHPFVDGNKRTALASTTVFYLINGYEFNYDKTIKIMLKELAIDANEHDREEIASELEALSTKMEARDVLLHGLLAMVDNLIEAGEIEDPELKDQIDQYYDNILRPDGGNTTK